MNRFIPSAPSLGLASLMAVVTLGLSSAAQAALVSADFRKPGDGLLTRDTRTGLEWLDLSQTQRYTYAQLAGGAGGFIEKGRFQFASASQVENLLKSARLEPSPFPASAQVSGDAVGVYRIQTLLDYESCSLSESGPYVTQKVCYTNVSFGKIDQAGNINRLFYTYVEVAGEGGPFPIRQVLSAGGGFSQPEPVPASGLSLPTLLVRRSKACTVVGTERPCPVQENPGSVWTNIP
jgi:hypothetical protein